MESMKAEMGLCWVYVAIKAWKQVFFSENEALYFFNAVASCLRKRPITLMFDSNVLTLRETLFLIDNINSNGVCRAPFKQPKDT